MNTKTFVLDEAEILQISAVLKLYAEPFLLAGTLDCYPLLKSVVDKFSIEL